MGNVAAPSYATMDKSESIYLEIKIGYLFYTSYIDNISIIW